MKKNKNIAKFLIIISLFGIFSFFTKITFAEITLTTESLKRDSVVLKATGLEQNTNFIFSIHNNINSSTTPQYFKQQETKSDSMGVATSFFTELSPLGTYTATINKTNNNNTLGMNVFTTPEKDIETRITDVTENTATLEDNSVIIPQSDPSIGGGSTVTDLSMKGDGLLKNVDCPEGGCGFNEFIEMINNVINFVLFIMVIPIAAIMFAYAGFTLITSGGSSEKKSVAKNTFTSVAMGLVIAVASWLIINTILSILGFDGAWIGFTG